MLERERLRLQRDRREFEARFAAMNPLNRRLNPEDVPENVIENCLIKPNSQLVKSLLISSNLNKGKVQKYFRATLTYRRTL